MSAAAGSRILVIEDDPSGAVLIERILSRVGHAVTVALTGAEGLAQLGSSLYDLVVIDKNLPDADGIRLLRDIRSAHPRVKTVVITAYPSTPTRTAAHGLGALGYLSKPFEISELLSICTQALGAPASTLGQVQQRVLVVDDDDSVARLSSQVLSREGFQIDVARSEQAALDLLARGPYDVLLVDRFLPGGDGLALARQARARLPNLAVILMTAGEAPSGEVRALLDGYLGKPFRNLRALVDEVRRVLEARRKPAQRG